MFENFVNRIQGFLPTLVSAFQNNPRLFWLVLGLLATVIVYLATLPRRRPKHVQHKYPSFSRTVGGNWFPTPFKGAVVYQFLRLNPKAFVHKGKKIEANDLEIYQNGEIVDGGNYWARVWDDPYDVDVIVMKRQRSTPKFSLKTIIALAIVVILGLLGWFVIKPAMERRAERELPTETIEAPISPTMSAPLAEQDDIIPSPSPVVTPEPERIDEFSIVVDLDKPAGPGQLEQLLLALGDKLPVFPDIIPDWVSFGAAKHPTQVAKLEGLPGFVILFATDQGLELHRVDDQFVKIGDTLYISDDEATLLAGDATKGLGYDVDGQQWLETIDYPRGKIRVLVTEHGNPAMQVISTGLVYNHRPWYPWAVGIAVILVIGLLIWRRRR